MKTPSPIEKELYSVFNREEPIVVFDIGSCEGMDSFRYAGMFPKATVYAFEPLPDNFNIIQHCLTEHSVINVKAFPYALSKITGKATFHISSGTPEGKETEDWNFGNKSSSLYAPGETLNKRPWLKFEESIEVDTMTIEDFCREQAVEQIDFIHMDVQGAELDVLEGAGDILQKLSLVWMEVGNIELYKGQPLKSDVEKFMQAASFIKVKDTAKKDAGDQLYIHKRLKDKIPASSLLGKLRDVFKR